MSEPAARSNRGMLFRVAALGVVALLLVWRTGCSNGSRRVASACRRNKRVFGSSAGMLVMACSPTIG